MVKVTFDSKDKKLLVKIKGHAGQAEKGHDVICASCTILAYSIAQIVKNAEIDGKLEIAPKIRLTDGDAMVMCRPKEAFYKEILQSFITVETGYTLLTHNFPQYVELKSFGKA